MPDADALTRLYIDTGGVGRQVENALLGKAVDTYGGTCRLLAPGSGAWQFLAAVRDAAQQIGYAHRTTTLPGLGPLHEIAAATTTMVAISAVTTAGLPVPGIQELYTLCDEGYIRFAELSAGGPRLVGLGHPLMAFELNVPNVSLGPADIAALILPQAFTVQAEAVALQCIAARVTALFRVAAPVGVNSCVAELCLPSVRATGAGIDLGLMNGRVFKELYDGRDCLGSDACFGIYKPDENSLVVHRIQLKLGDGPINSSGGVDEALDVVLGKFLTHKQLSQEAYEHAFPDVKVEQRWHLCCTWDLGNSIESVLHKGELRVLHRRVLCHAGVWPAAVVATGVRYFVT